MFFSTTGRRLLTTIAARPHRVLMNVPASDSRKLEKSRHLAADVVVYDLEDGVAAQERPKARVLLQEFLQQASIASSGSVPAAAAGLRVVRINSDTELGRADWTADLQALRPLLAPNERSPPLDGLLLTKVNGAAEVNRVAEFLRQQQNTTTRLFVTIESAKAIVALQEICAAAPDRMHALVFGSEDYLADLGGTRTVSMKELLYPRSKIACYARAFGLFAFDAVCLDFRSPERLTLEATEARQMGYTGKQAIHPAQLEPIQRAFSASPEELNFARRILRSAQENFGRGVGAWEIDGKMIDKPMVLWAERIVATTTTAPPTANSDNPRN